MLWDLTGEEKKKLIQYMWDVGFIFDSTPLMNLKTDEERFERIKEYVKQGYRIMIVLNQPEVVNVKGESISSELYDELLEAYKWLTSTSDKSDSAKAEEHNKDYFQFFNI